MTLAGRGIRRVQKALVCRVGVTVASSTSPEMFGAGLQNPVPLWDLDDRQREVLIAIERGQPINPHSR